MVNLKTGRLKKEDHVIVWGSLRSVVIEKVLRHYIEASDISVLSNVVEQKDDFERGGEPCHH